MDIEPISHLYKSQIYQLADHFDIVQAIKERPATPDTYSSEISDEEFYFRMPFDKLDLLLYAWENKIPLEDICASLNLTENQVQRAFKDFTSKWKATKHIRELPPSCNPKRYRYESL